MPDYKVPNLDEFSYQQPVKDKDLTSPPGGESTGDRYLIYGVGSGAWSGQDGNIAIYNGIGWDFAVKSEGMIIYIKDEDIFYQYISSWTVFSGSVGPTGPTGATGPTGTIDYNDASAIIAMQIFL